MMLDFLIWTDRAKPYTDAIAAAGLGNAVRVTLADKDNPPSAETLARTEAMFSGEKINVTEKRAVLHVALRAPKTERIMVDGANVVPAVHAVLDRMARFSDAVRSGAWL